MSGKLEIHWAPINKKFITWGADINLYQIHHINKESGLSGIPESQCKSLFILKKIFQRSPVFFSMQNIRLPFSSISGNQFQPSLCKKYRYLSKM